MTQKEKDRWLDQKIKTGIPGIWWTERYKKYYAKYKKQLLGEFNTESQAIEVLAKTIRSLEPFQIRKERYTMKRIEAYETYEQITKIIACRRLHNSCGDKSKKGEK